MSSKTYRTELGVDMVVYQLSGWTEIVALGPYTDRASVFDHKTFDTATGKRELRNALRRHARLVKHLATA